MTALPEAKLAREAELPYATLALATDYDAWHEHVAAVSVDAVVTVMRQNSALAKQVVARLAEDLPDPERSPAYRALDGSLITESRRISARARRDLEWLLGPALARQTGAP